MKAAARQQSNKAHRRVAPPQIDTKASILRMKHRLSARSDADLAEKLGVGKATISSWRQRNSIPLESCIQAAWLCGASVDWLIFGEDAGVRNVGLRDGPINVGVMALALFKLDYSEAGRQLSISSITYSDSAFRAKLLVQAYYSALAFVEETQRSTGLSFDDACKALRKAFEIEHSMGIAAQRDRSDN